MSNIDAVTETRSNVVFTLYHYGAWEFTTSKVLELFFVGCFVGLLYRGTGSLIIAIVFHSIYDAIWCFTEISHEAMRIYFLTQLAD